MLSIDYGFGALGILAMVLVAGAGVIAAAWLFAAARQARDEVVTDEHDRGNDDVPLA